MSGLGGLNKSKNGVVLLDALYGELDKFIPWITKANRGFFVSAFTGSTRRQNSTLESILAEIHPPDLSARPLYWALGR